MARALIGHTGFVGGTIFGQTHFDDTFNSSNIETIRGRSYEVIVCAAAPGRKWLANREPDEDRKSIDRLMGALDLAEAGDFVLISPVDVYPVPVGVDESTPIDNAENDAYGRHRRLLEEFVESRFGGLTVRLPGLFGAGLKKNAIYDLLNDNRVDLIPPDSVFQFYDMSELWRDVERCRALGLGLVNFATPPLSARDMARDVFGVDLRNDSAPPPVRYDMRTRFASALGGHGDYLCDLEHVLDGMRRFVEKERNT
jgi:nucleoside-diphosphate-sugar epimerase